MPLPQVVCIGVGKERNLTAEDVEVHKYTISLAFIRQCYRSRWSPALRGGEFSGPPHARG